MTRFKPLNEEAEYHPVFYSFSSAPLSKQSNYVIFPWDERNVRENSSVLYVRNNLGKNVLPWSLWFHLVFSNTQVIRLDKDIFVFYKQKLCVSPPVAVAHPSP